MNRPEPFGAASPPERDLCEPIVTACGYRVEELSRDAENKIIDAATQLAALHVTPDLVRRGGAAYRRLYPSATMTPHALTHHWPALMAELRGERATGGASNVSPIRPPEHKRCEHCGLFPQDCTCVDDAEVGS